MTSRKCGTCYFFQEAGIAGSGWCRNDLFRKSDDVRTLVRRNELACRDGWNKSLWTDPRDAARSGAALQPIATHAERPATEGEIGFMVNSRDSQPNRQSRKQDDDPGGEDVVVGSITVAPPGHTGRRRLVDQVPIGLPDGDVPFGDDDRERAPSHARTPDRPATPVEPEHVGDERDRALQAETRRAIREARERRRQRMIGLPAPTGRDARERVHDARPRAGEILDGPDDGRGEHRDDDIRAPIRSAAHAEASPNEPTGDGPATPPGRRAPIPGPVPAGERLGRHQRPPSAADRTGGLPSLDAQTPRKQAERRPVLPDLPDDFFTQGVLDPVSRSTSDEHMAGRDPRLTAPHGAPASRRTVASSGQASTEPNQRVRGNGAVTVVGAGVSQSAARSRPAVPRLNGGVARPSSPPAAGLPTVAEANQVAEPVHRQGPRPPLFQRATAGPASTDRPNGSAVGRPVMAAQQPSVDRDRSTRPTDRRARPPEPQRPSEHVARSREPEDVVLGLRPDAGLPSEQLRPRAEDFGQYGGWFDLESVEPVVAPELPRCCETCRDFRPSENGERGWCANREAFSHRRMVSAGDLPCISSFGCWWLPFDDVWLAEANIRKHRQPTPLLDRMLPDESDDGRWERQQRRS